jgi:hypothetical protein
VRQLARISGQSGETSIPFSMTSQPHVLPADDRADDFDLMCSTDRFAAVSWTKIVTIPTNHENWLVFKHA